MNSISAAARAGVRPATREMALAWLLLASLAVAYLIVFSRLTSWPMQDYANHMARADVMADLLFDHGARFGNFFQLRLMPVPYVLPDLVLAGFLAGFGVTAGGALFTALVLVSLPCALLVYLDRNGFPREARPFVLVLGLFLSADWFFVVGFMAFRLAIAEVIVMVAAADALRLRWSAGGYIGYLVIVAIGFLTHLSAPVFGVVALGSAGAWRLLTARGSWKAEAALLAPLIAVLLAYVAATHGYQPHSGTFLYDWAGPGGGRAWARKIRNILYEFRDFDPHLALPLMAALALLLLWTLRGVLSDQRSANWPPALERLAIAIAFMAAYLALPSETRDTMFVDVRALPLVAIFVLLACLSLPRADAVTSVFAAPSAIGLAALLAIGNLLYLGIPLTQNNSWVQRYRQVVAAIPAGATVLPVHTETGRLYLLHVWSHILLDRGAIFPYMFNANAGDPMLYFRYRRQLYTPDYHWYRSRMFVRSGAAPIAVDWRRIACDYEFVLATEPFDAGYLGVPVSAVRSNEAATLLRIDGRACGTGALRR